MGGRGGGGSGGSRKAGRGKAAGSAPVERVESNPALKASPGMRITKVAEETFNSNYRDVRRGMEVFGADPNIAAAIDFGDRGYVSLQTLKGIQAKINSEQRRLDNGLKLGTISQEKANARRMALNALQRGLNTTYQEHKKYWKGDF